MLLTGAQILIEELVRNNVDTVFGYPGGAVLDIYDELYKNEARLRHVISAHEQGAAHAADGYARVTGKAGVVIATSGPGAANLVTGIANAYLDSVPLVVITGNVATALLGKDSFQEVDIVGITQPIVKHNHIVRDVKDLASELASAFQVALSGRRGPVLIDIPKDVQKAKCEYKSCETAQNDNRIMGSIKEAIEAINKCEKPYIYSGGGVIAAKAEKEVLALSQKISAPIGLSMMGLTAIPHSYQLNLGMCGMHGKYAASVAQSKSDLMIAVGVRFSDRATGDIGEYTKNCRVIHIDIDHAELGKNVPEIIELCGDAKQILSAILEKIDEKHNNEWIETIVNDLQVDVGGQTEFVDDNSFSPKNIIHTIREYSNDDTIIATDVGQHQMWVMQNYAFAKSRTLLTSGGLGTMGYGLGAAIGGCIACGKKRTVLFTGDGSFGMNLNELATAVSQELPITIVLMNNGVLGMVRQWQGMFYEEHYSSTTLNRKTDFPALAKAFGADGVTITSIAELRKVLNSNLPDNKPFLIDCHIDMDEKVFPMIPPGGSVRDIRIG